MLKNSNDYLLLFTSTLKNSIPIWCISCNIFLKLTTKLLIKYNSITEENIDKIQFVNKFIE